MTAAVAGARTVGELLAALPAGRPVVLGVDGTALDGPDLVASARAIRAALAGLGLDRRATVALVLPGGPAAAVAFLAVAAVATAAPLDPTAPPAELARLLDQRRADAVILAAGRDPVPLRAAIGGRPVLAVELGPGGLRVSSADPAPAPPSPGPGDHVAGPGPGDVALVLATSGTTSAPKLVPLAHANLLASARAQGAFVGLTADDRGLDVLPLFHILGLGAALLTPLAAGGSVVVAPGFLAPELPRWLTELGVTWFTAVPAVHQALLARLRRRPEPALRGRLRFVRSGSAALSVGVLTELEEVFGCPVIEGYGMTEAAPHIANNPLPPRARKPGSVGVPVGCEIRVIDEHLRPLPPGEIGEVAVRGPNVITGYLRDPAADAAGFTPDGWFRTGDLGRLDTDGYLWLTGRLKEQINRGGEKVEPSEVDRVLRAHPAVADALTFGVPDRRLGEQVAAAVVLRPGASVTERELRRFAHARLAPHKVPRRVVVVDAIPLGPTGKRQRVGTAQRLGLADLDDLDVADGAAPTAPRDAIEAFVAGLWAEVLGIDEVGVHDRFLDLGGDSILATRLLARLRAELELDLSVLDLFDRPTVAEQAALVTELLEREQDNTGREVR